MLYIDTEKYRYLFFKNTGIGIRVKSRYTGIFRYTAGACPGGVENCKKPYIYVLKKILNLKYFCPKTINLQFKAKFQKVGGTTVTVTLTVTVKNFSWGNVAKMK